MSNVTNILLSIIDRRSELLEIVSILVATRKISHGARQFAGVFVFLSVVTVLIAAIPLLVILLVSSGAIDILNLRWVGGWADRLALVFDFLIPCFLVFLPQLLRRKLTWEDLDGNDSANVRTLLPTWLAFLAAMATAGLIFTLHFIKGGQLPRLNPWLAVSPSIAIVTLPIPLSILLPMP